MRVGNAEVPWLAGQSVVFDDSFEHEVWNRTEVDRVVLLFDVWHPDLTLAEKVSINEMFASTKRPE
jgi:aspartyl/asparaginyl beta-hydroxylase (cupin superfamily)